MLLKQIFSNRSKAGQNYAQPIIYEWEDIISEKLQIPVTPYPTIYRLVNRFNIHSRVTNPFTNTFRFVINGQDNDEPINSKHIIPCIIDFFIKPQKLDDFYRKHSRNKIILVSSPFDYQYLKENKCPIPIGLFAYSLSDKWNFTNNQTDKKYDIVLTGRQDPLLYSFFMEYVKKHPDITYVKRGKNLENDNQKTKEYYVNGKECIGQIETREDFIKLQSQGRTTLYGVQGYLDGFTKGFYHITPHFLEMVACGCHIIARYPSGSNGIDAEYYEINQFSDSIESYDKFEAAMDQSLNSDIDVNKYSSYLKKHYTSARIQDLTKMLTEL